MDTLANNVSVVDLDFEVKVKPLQAICGTQIVTSQKHQAIHSGDLLLGVQPFKVTDPSIINHYQAYQIGEELYSQLFGDGSSKACFLSEDKSWMASLIGKYHDNNAGYNHENISSSLFANPFSTQSELLIYQELTENGFTPSIGVVNGFDFNDSLGFYLLVEPIRHSDARLSVLTLASFKVEEKHASALKKYGTNKKEAILQLLHNLAVPKFREHLTSFNHLYSKLAKWPLDKESLIAISLDIYDKNRNAASISADTLLSTELSRFIKSADLHFTEQDTVASILNFIIRYNEFNTNRSKYPRRKVEQLFVQKMSYKKLGRIFDKLLRNSPEFEGYQHEQIRSYKATMEALAGAVV